MFNSDADIEQHERVRNVKVTEIPPLGYGTESASISYRKQIESGELSPEIAQKAVEIIASGRPITEVTEEDDGCIDGRTAVEVMYIDQDESLQAAPVTEQDSHERAKVAGGGYMTALAMRRAIEPSASHIDADLRLTAQKLASKNIYCGAHTGSHGHGEATDCGANDKIAPILANGVRFRSEIADSTEALLKVAGLRYDQSIFNGVMSGWAETINHPEYFEGSTGASRLGVITDSIKEAQANGDARKPLAVTKHLGGDHKEDFVIINYTQGKTFSQAKFREELAAAFPDVPDEKRAQAFVVDVWRIVELAQAIGDTDAEKASALYAGVAYQLATAATLTDGSLRTFVVAEK